MMRVRRVVLTLLAASALIWPVAAQAPTPAPPPAKPPAAGQSSAGRADTGRKLYVSYGCWQCHGYEGQGGAAGPRLAARSLPFASFSRYIRRPTNQMPPYTDKVVSDADLTHIHAYLQSRAAPPPVDSIPLLRNQRDE